MKQFPISFPPLSTMIEDIEELNAGVDEKQLEIFGKFAGILLERSARINLIGPRERGRLWRRHFLESIQYALLLDKREAVVDIGSGNGFPGMILAIMGYRMILLEPRRKRYLFLDYASSELGLDNCMTVPLRLENFNPEEEVKQFVARAVAPPALLLARIAEIAGEGSMLVYRQPEISGNEEFESYVELNCPPLDRNGFLVQYRV
ncbi:16S rRNA (guanine(527)-N(7))-methyltransferase RsmG [Candidatus Fermentibacteria bacterium]|nr:MAG: 16S rRNA (guanine(527)-N(7))-methyltransferase RsmG [Candidatus Fermentibacteria bacterium]